MAKVVKINGIRQRQTSQFMIERFQKVCLQLRVRLEEGHNFSINETSYMPYFQLHHQLSDEV